MLGKRGLLRVRAVCPSCDAILAGPHERYCIEMRCAGCATMLWVVAVDGVPRVLPAREAVSIESYIADVVADGSEGKLTYDVVLECLRGREAAQLNLDSVGYIELVLEIEDALKGVR